jgi:hypothetical protein
VWVTPGSSWIQDGILALPEPLPPAFDELKPLRLPTRWAAQPEPAALVTVTLTC